MADELLDPRDVRPRLVATDLDGTLLDSEGKVTDRTRAVLGALDEMGVPVVFTTGRPLRWMEELWEEVGGHGLAIVSNGGIVFDVAGHKISRSRTIPVDVLVRVGEILRETIPGTAFALESTHGFSREAEFFPRLAVSRMPDTPIGRLEEIADDQVVKLLARHETLEAEPFWHEVEAQVGSLVTTTWSSMGPLVEISGSGVTKASTLEMLTADLGINAAEVVAFGDMPNDLPLLGWAGRSYAMSNGHRSVIDLAQHVAPSNDEDGVAQTLAALFGIDA
ncbi:MAG: Cof-type HAD-IIB family hydrolase [Nocardioides sp.]|uniref:Cof-type HAD-IIB family hydrolase n=1 Tax=Nocardioides sp. TaxID=35761 RepID=UPI003F08E185